MIMLDLGMILANQHVVSEGRIVLLVTRKLETAFKGEVFVFGQDRFLQSHLELLGGVVRIISSTPNLLTFLRARRYYDLVPHALREGNRLSASLGESLCFAL